MNIKHILIAISTLILTSCAVYEPGQGPHSGPSSMCYKIQHKLHAGRYDKHYHARMSAAEKAELMKESKRYGCNEPAPTNQNNSKKKVTVTGWM